MNVTLRWVISVCYVTCQCKDAPAGERISVEGRWTDLVETFKHALRHSSASISFVELNFGDVRTGLSGITSKSSVVALNFYALDFSGYIANEFHLFVLAFMQLRTLKLDYRCTTSHNHLTNAFLLECVLKGLVDVTFENIPTDADRYDLTDECILDFISYDGVRNDR